MAEFYVTPASWPTDQVVLQALRRRVFIEEQSVPEDEEWDGLDARCEHVLARAADGTPIGCGRLTPEHAIGRMAVVPDWRGRGVGSALLVALLDRARDRHWPEVGLHAQVSALDFYRRHGFDAFGPRFMEAGIEHQLMRKALAPRQLPPARRGAPPAPPEAQPLACRDAAELRQATLHLLGQTRHRIDLHSRQLAPLLADDDEVLAELRRIATSGRQARLRCLIHDPDQLLRTGHRLVGLAQRLESSIELRVVSERDDRAYSSAFLLNDRRGYLLQRHVAAFDADGNSHAPARHAQLQGYFNDVWTRSLPATALRRLDL